MSWLFSIVSFVLKLWEWIHDGGQQRIGAQKQEINDLAEASHEAIEANRTAEKIHALSDADLDNDLAGRMHDDP